MSELLGKTKSASAAGHPPGPAAVLQRKCACGGPAGLTGQCDGCRQKRLAVGAVGDAYEQEADRVADRVMGKPGARLGAAGGSVPAGPLVQRRSAPGAVHADVVPPSVHDTLSATGAPLDRTTRTFFERRFGHDFGRVRVHADARAAESSDAVDALAYTVGAHVVFAAGQYAPGTRAGNWLLAHELAHMDQQSRSGSPALQRLSRTQSPTAWSFASNYREYDQATYERLLAGIAPERAALQAEADAAIDPVPVLRDVVRLTALDLMNQYRSEMIAARDSLRDPAAGAVAVSTTKDAAQRILALDQERRALERSLFALGGLTQSVSPFSDEWANTIAEATNRKALLNPDIEEALATYANRKAEAFAESNESIGWTLVIDLTRARTQQIRRTTDQINAIYKEVPYLTQFYLRDPLTEEAESFIGDLSGDFVSSAKSAMRKADSVVDTVDVLGILGSIRQYERDTVQSTVSTFAGPTLEQFANNSFGSNAAYVGQLRDAYDQLTENIDDAIGLIGSEGINPFQLPEAVRVAGVQQPAFKKQLDALKKRAELIALAKTLGLTVIEAAVALIPVVGEAAALATNLYSSVSGFQNTLDERTLGKAAPSPEGTLGVEAPRTGEMLAGGATVALSALGAMARVDEPHGDFDLSDLTTGGPRRPGETLLPESTPRTTGTTRVPESELESPGQRRSKPEQSAGEDVVDVASTPTARPEPEPPTFSADPLSGDLQGRPPRLKQREPVTSDLEDLFGPHEDAQLPVVWQPSPEGVSPAEHAQVPLEPPHTDGGGAQPELSHVAEAPSGEPISAPKRKRAKKPKEPGIREKRRLEEFATRQAEINHSAWRQSEIQNTIERLRGRRQEIPDELRKIQAVKRDALAAEQKGLPYTFPQELQQEEIRTIAEIDEHAAGLVGEADGLGVQIAKQRDLLDTERAVERGVSPELLARIERRFTEISRERIAAAGRRDQVFGTTTANLSVDHIVPQSEIRNMAGFSRLPFERQVHYMHLESNLVVMSFPANSSKGASSWLEWREGIRYVKDRDPTQWLIIRAKWIAREDEQRALLSRAIATEAGVPAPE